MNQLASNWNPPPAAPRTSFISVISNCVPGWLILLIYFYTVFSFLRLSYWLCESMRLLPLTADRKRQEAAVSGLVSGMSHTGSGHQSLLISSLRLPPLWKHHRWALMTGISSGPSGRPHQPCIFTRRKTLASDASKRQKVEICGWHAKWVLTAPARKFGRLDVGAMGKKCLCYSQGTFFFSFFPWWPLCPVCIKGRKCGKMPGILQQPREKDRL